MLSLAKTVSDPEHYVMISALQHYVYCPRQCALIHIEKVWDENLYTLRVLAFGLGEDWNICG